MTCKSCEAIYTQAATEIAQLENRLAEAVRLIDALIESHEGEKGSDFWASEMGKKVRISLAHIAGNK